MISFAGIILGYINVLYFFPAYLTPGQIGLTRVIQDFAMLLVPFAQLGTSQAVIRFFPTFRNNKKKANNFFSLILFLALMGFVTFLVVLVIFQGPITSLFNENSPEVTQYFYLVIILIFILIIYNIVSDFIRSNLEIVIPNFVREVLLRLLTTFSIALFVFRLADFQQFLYLIVGAYFVNLSLLSLYLFKKTDTRFSFRFYNAFSKTEFKSILWYGLYVLIGAGGAMIVAKVDTLMVTSMMGTYFTGIYTTSFYIAVIIEIPRRMVTQISTPLIARNLSSNNVHGIFDIYTKSSLNLMIVGMFILIGLWANLENIYHFIPNKAIYETGKWVVIIIGTGKLLDMSFGLNGEIIILSKYYKINILLTGFLAIVTISLNLILIPLYGLNGAAMGNALALIFFNILKYFYVWNKFKMQPFTGNHIILLVIGSAILLPSLILPSLDNKLADILVRSSIISVVFVLSIYYSKISKEINETIDGLINKLFK